ncbi:S-layer homology domain-containing protein [uncultured Jatrophihabitans sp.]|uniref:S-layer homology domain-containing protein n=1 Tax=uncultured Jatrophihabitans sp. TaxID=1610747 RepID=UPI0035C9CECE
MIESPSSKWTPARRLTIASCAAVGLVAVSLVAPTLAAAAATPTLNVTFPQVVGNSSAGGAAGSIVIGAGDAAITTATVGFTISAPTGTSAISISGLPQGDMASAFTPSNGTFSGTVTVGNAIAANGTSGSIPFTLSVTAPGVTSGTLTSNETLTVNSAATPSASDGPDTSTIAAGSSAPKFNVPGPATVHQAYSTTVLSPGAPKPSVKVYDNKPNSGASGTTATAVSPTTAANGDKLYALNDKLVFNSTTGTVTGSAVDLAKTDASPGSFTIIANNGVGGASTAAPATASTPAVVVHDVSQTITIPVLFSDVAVSSQFGKAIYALSADGILGGYGDGTFRPGTTVTRQAFVHFAAGVLNKGGFTTPTGACTTANPSSFSDVSNSSPFCQDINALSSLGVVNGYSNGTFKPGATVSRQAEAAFLYRVDEKFRGVDPKTGGDALCTSPSPFKDVSSSNTFCGDIEWASKNGIAKGYSDGGFHPAAGSSRQASAQFIYQLEVLEKLV